MRKLNEGKFDIRLDENLTSKDTLFARFSYDQAQSYVPGGAPGSPNRAPLPATKASPIMPATRPFRRLTSFRRPQSTNSASVSTAFSTTSLRRETAVVTRAALGIPGANLGGNSCGLTSVEMDGDYWSLGDRGYTPFVGGTNVWTFSDSLDMVRGNHDIRVGGSIFAPIS